MANQRHLKTKNHTVKTDKVINRSNELKKKDDNSPRNLRLLAEDFYADGNKRKALEQLALARQIIPKNKNLKKRYMKIKYGKLFFWIKNMRFS